MGHPVLARAGETQIPFGDDNPKKQKQWQRQKQKATTDAGPLREDNPESSGKSEIDSGGQAVTS
jgi:hypothetical protein